MNKPAIKILALSSFLPFAAQADILGATAGVDFWYADAKINDVRADDAKFQASFHVALEHPIPSRLWLLPFISYILKVCHSVFIIDLDQCAWVKRPGDWEPHHGDVRTKRGPDSS